MNIQTATAMYEQNNLAKLYIINDPMHENHKLLVIEDTKENSFTIHTTRGIVKSYASLDSVEADIRRIVGAMPTMTISL